MENDFCVNNILPGYSAATIIEPSSSSTERNSIEPQIEATSQRDPEMEPVLERSVSPTASTSADFQASRPVRRIRRKLDQSLTGTKAKVCNAFAFNNYLLIVYLELQ